MSDKSQALSIIKKAQDDLDTGVISRRDFNLIMVSFGALAGFTLFSSYAAAWTGARMRKSTAATTYQLQRSLRFRAIATAYLSRTPSSSTNRCVFTFSCWLKAPKNNTTLISAGDGTNQSYTTLSFGDTVTISHAASGTVYVDKQSTAYFRDPSAWYHLVMTFNNGVIKFYVNGVELTSWAVNTNTLGAGNTYFNHTNLHTIGKITYANNPIDSYLSGVYFIDGQALLPTSFGEFNSQTEQWTSIKYNGTYGTNGYALDFSDPTTTATLCLDRSGNANNWTPNNISVSAGVTYDSMLDTPLSSGGSERGNYAIMNPLTHTSPSTPAALSNANLRVVTPSTGGGNVDCVVSTLACQIPAYFEVYIESISAGGATVAIWLGLTQSDSSPLTTFAGWVSNYSGSGNTNGAVTRTSGVETSASAYQLVNGDLLGFAYDSVTGKCWLAKNGTWILSGNPTAGTSPVYTFNIASGNVFAMVVGRDNSNAVQFNFGQRPFTYTPPTGFKALHTGNFSAPIIKKPSEYFNIKTYVGDGTDGRVLSLPVDTDFAWTKQRSGAVHNMLNDRVRGNDKALITNLQNAESSYTGYYTFGSVGSKQSTISYTGSGGNEFGYNQNTHNYVSWLWKAGGVGVANNSGSISSVISANTTSGFSIVKWTGTGANATIGHGLGLAPGMIIMKPVSAVDNWPVWHSAFSNLEYVYLNNTNAKTSLAAMWNSAIPTSSVFSVGTNSNSNTNGSVMIAYCFSEIAGFSRIGSYVGNGNADGVFVYCGFRPAWIMWKAVSTTGQWFIHDTKRSLYNFSDLELCAETTQAEYSASGAGAGQRFDIVSNGFKIRTSNNANNSSGVTYIYIALAEAPLKYALGR